MKPFPRQKVPGLEVSQVILPNIQGRNGTDSLEPVPESSSRGTSAAARTAAPHPRAGQGRGGKGESPTTVPPPHRHTEIPRETAANQIQPSVHRITLAAQEVCSWCARLTQGSTISCYNPSCEQAEEKSYIIVQADATKRLTNLDAHLPSNLSANTGDFPPLSTLGKPRATQGPAPSANCGR